MRSDQPTLLTSYVTQRHAKLTEACEIVDRLKLPMRRLDSDGHDVGADTALRAVELALATTVHPEVVSWFGTHAMATYQECRALAAMKGNDALGAIEPLILRDVEILASAKEIFGTLSAEQQATVVESVPRDIVGIMAIDAVRFTYVMSGAVLFAWQDEWQRALKIIHRLYGGVAPPESSMVEAFDQRLGDVEADLAAVRTQMAVASAAFRPVERPVPGDAR